MAAPLLQVARVTQKCLTCTSCSHMFVAQYAKKVGGAAGKMAAQTVSKVRLDVETDPGKLTRYCCGANIYTTGSDPELKPDSEYPEWLWSLRLDRKPVGLSELDPDDFPYWRRLRRLSIKQKNQLLKVSKLKRN